MKENIANRLTNAAEISINKLLAKEDPLISLGAFGIIDGVN